MCSLLCWISFVKNVLYNFFVFCLLSKQVRTQQRTHAVFCTQFFSFYALSSTFYSNRSFSHYSQDAVVTHHQSRSFYPAGITRMIRLLVLFKIGYWKNSAVLLRVSTGSTTFRTHFSYYSLYRLFHQERKSSCL